MADDDPAYLEFVRQQRCIACDAEPPVQPHHHTHNRGMGQRAPDRDAVPLCWRCHRLFHDGAGRFAGMLARERRALQDHWVAATQETWDHMHNTDVF